MTPRKLDYSDQGGYGGERTNPFDEPTGTNPFGDEPTTREMKGNKNFVTKYRFTLSAVKHDLLFIRFGI